MLLQGSAADRSSRSWEHAQEFQLTPRDAEGSTDITPFGQNGHLVLEQGDRNYSRGELSTSQEKLKHECGQRAGQEGSKEGSFGRRQGRPQRRQLKLISRLLV